MSVVVFTAILGGSDSLKPAPHGADQCVCFTDDVDRETQGWTLRPWTWSLTSTSRREAWRLRCVPHTLFEAYSTVIWVDASYTVTNLGLLLNDSAGFDLCGLRHHTRLSCYEEGREVVANGQADADDVDQQLMAYRRENFKPTALTVSCILVRSHTAQVTDFNELWDAEIQTHPGDNTQISLDYAAWKVGLRVHHLEGFRKATPYALHDHVDHKRRRKPYR